MIIRPSEDIVWWRVRFHRRVFSIPKWPLCPWLELYNVVKAETIPPPASRIDGMTAIAPTFPVLLLLRSSMPVVRECLIAELL
jgi:hypothetical protein